jgi:uncharacterized protein
MFALNLAKIRTPRSEFARVYAPGELATDTEGFAVAGPVSLAFDIEKDKDRFRLAGRVQTTLVLPCSRCLEGFEQDVDAPFDLRFQPKDTATTVESERELGEDDLAAAFYENDEIDLELLMKEQFYLALPMKPLCRDECRGLCALCGANLNRGTCGCSASWEDPRFAALKALKKES